MSRFIAGPDFVVRYAGRTRGMQRDRAAAVGALPGNPCGAEARAFGSVLAVRYTTDFLRGKNHVFGLAVPELDRLDEILAFYRERGLGCAFTVDEEPFAAAARGRLAAAGVHQVGVQTPLVAVPSVESEPPLPGVVIRRIAPAGPDLDRFLDLLLDGFRNPSLQRSFERVENELDCVRLFVAEVGGELAAIASMSVRDGIGSLISGATVARFRGRGIQTALIRRRLAVAAEEGCSAVVAHADLFSTSFRNLRRCGFEQLAFGSVWRDFSA
jgi:hypothetical protein